MNKAFYILSFLIISNFNSFSQSSINDYKYIIVPSKFEFLKEQDQYQVNSLAKFLFNKYGYTAFLQDEDLPADLRNNRCLALTADVEDDNSIFKTKLRINLKDCNDNVIISSQVGETREKEFSKAYGLALREAFETFQHLEYSYSPSEAITSKGTLASTDFDEKEQAEIARLKEEIKTLKKEPVITELDPELTEVEEVESTESIKKPISIEKEVNVVEDSVITTGFLYAQPIENGFQLVDTTPKKVMILRNSGVKDVFTVEGKSAIVFKKGDVWMYSESGDILKGKPINIKF